MLQGLSLKGVKQINSEPVLHHRLKMELDLFVTPCCTLYNF